MRVCIITEGSYPYVVGGVSSWIHNLIKAFSDVEFVLWEIVSDRHQEREFMYELPENLTEIYEVYLQDDDWDINGSKEEHKRLKKNEYEVLKSLMIGVETDWHGLFEMLHSSKYGIEELLMGEDFLHFTREFYDREYSQIPFCDFLWTLRSIYMPLFQVIRSEIPKAEIYHCVATGYSGVLGSMAKYYHKGGLLLSEHGIYTREREEELIKANWVDNVYKKIWVDQFHKMSRLVYDEAESVVSLFPHARSLQVQIGCPKEKTLVIPNGIYVDRFQNLPDKRSEELGIVNIGAIVRVTPIKDIKTMIQAFYFASKKVPNLHLWVMGNTEEEPEYAKECFELVSVLGIENLVTFTGIVNVTEYLGRMDMTILTSISEGQPLTILESFAASKPVIATDVGDCRGLIYGNKIGDKEAGILTHVMNVEEISDAIVKLATNEELCKFMGQVGRKRVAKYHRIEEINDRYRDLYKEIYKNNGVNQSKRKLR